MKVLIIYRYIAHYRLAFYKGMYNELTKKGIELTLVFGDVDNTLSVAEVQKVLPWAEYIPNKKIQFGGIEMIWQPSLKQVSKSDIVIVEQANRLLINYILIIMRLFWKKKKLAFWGHGLNLQDNPKSIANKFKYSYIRRVDWWFAYTESVNNTLLKSGFKSKNITVVQNCFDTNEDLHNFNTIRQDELNDVKKRYCITDKQIILIYCGRLYGHKNIPFLLESYKLIQQKIENSLLIIIGDGKDKEFVTNAQLSGSNILWLGTLTGKERIPFFYLAKLMLMPSAVGLSIIDSFIFKTPLVTTENRYNGPEIDYLKHNENGIITVNDLNTYTNEVVNILKDEIRFRILEKGCEEAAKKYTIENMINNFVIGISNLDKN